MAFPAIAILTRVFGLDATKHTQRRALLTRNGLSDAATELGVISDGLHDFV